MGSNRVLRSHLMKIFEIYANECFVEAVVTYLANKGYIKKLKKKLNELLMKHLQDQQSKSNKSKSAASISQESLYSVSIDTLRQVFAQYHKDEHSYKVLFDRILHRYLYTEQQQYFPNMEINYQKFLEIIVLNHQVQMDQKLLKAIILLTKQPSQVSHSPLFMMHVKSKESN